MDEVNTAASDEGVRESELTLSTKTVKFSSCIIRQLKTFTDLQEQQNENQRSKRS